jgi:hypothetical protein
MTYSAGKTDFVCSRAFARDALGSLEDVTILKAVTVRSKMNKVRKFLLKYAGLTINGY